MFYVSTISGAQVQFDPSVTPISRTVAAIDPVSQVTEVAAAEESAVNALAGNLTSQAETVQNEDAVVYDGRVAIFSTPPAATVDSANISRAGAVMAYHVQDAEFPSESEVSDGISAIGAIHHSEEVGIGSSESADRVNPIRREKYSPQIPQRERKPGVVAEDIMSAPVFSLAADLPIEEAQRVFQQRRYRHIPIVNSAGNLVGILSDRDFIFDAGRKVVAHTLIRDRMVTEILTARPQTEIRTVAEVMIKHRIGCLPIVNDQGVLKGILTRSDILRAIVNHAPIELWT